MNDYTITLAKPGTCQPIGDVYADDLKSGEARGQTGPQGSTLCSSSTVLLPQGPHHYCMCDACLCVGASGDSSCRSRCSCDPRGTRQMNSRVCHACTTHRSTSNALMTLPTNHVNQPYPDNEGDMRVSMWRQCYSYNDKHNSDICCFFFVSGPVVIRMLQPRIEEWNALFSHRSPKCATKGTTYLPAADNPFRASNVKSRSN